MINRLSLTFKMLVLMTTVGSVVWVVSDYYQTSELSAVLHERLKNQLLAEAREQRLQLYNRIKSYSPAVSMYASNTSLIDYIDQDEWQKNVNSQLALHKKIPVWLPKLSVMRSYILPHYAMLFDTDSRLRELYHYRYPLPPNELLNISAHELELSLDQSHITIIDDQPYLIAARNIGESIHKGTLLLATPVDDELLRESQGMTTNNSISALLKDGESRILVSSDNIRIPVGTEISLLEKHYMMTGEDHFGTGSSDFMIKIISLISTDEVTVQTEIMLSKDRKTRAINAFIYFIAFGLIMFWITARIQKLTRKVVEFSSNMKIKQPSINKGDQLEELGLRFELLASAIKEETSTLEHAALHDPLTNLANRVLFNNRLEYELLNGERLNQKFVLLISDLNNFKRVNDTLGHHIGDIVIRQAGEKLTGELRRNDTVARLGGDEFGMLLPNTSIDKSIPVIKKILDAFEGAFTADGKKLDIGISIGVVEYPTHGQSIDVLLQYADAAMYKAKKNRTGYEIFDSSSGIYIVPDTA
ncbi:MAG: GGDEF domain-containing protein [Gammaproteobacteria bacterium]|nr:GGDEF domain-containing protein [Gammaproteobacteria bacterium]